MTLQETFDKITERTAAARKQEGDIAQKLDGYKRNKADAEAKKAAALDAKDEQAYKEACRAVADAEAGIEFNSIILQGIRREQAATAAEDLEIKGGLNSGIREIYVDAMTAIEKALAELLDAAETAMKKFDAVDAMARAWDKSIMKDTSVNSELKFTSGRRETILQFVGLAKTRLSTLREGKKVDPYFRGGA